jgi:hypothetical protein
MVSAFIVFCEKKKVFGLLPFFLAAVSGRRGDTDSSLASLLLLFWFAGDTPPSTERTSQGRAALAQRGLPPALKSSRTVSRSLSRVRLRSIITYSQRITYADYCDLAWRLLKTF